VDDPAAFAERVLALFENPDAAAAMAERARAEVVTNWDMATITRKLVDGYHVLAREKRAQLPISVSDRV
jgi:glycosyltransferase involved in cell wall biosynthesis